MGYWTASTDWPSIKPVPEPVKALIELFYSLADDTSSSAGDRMADEVFTSDGVMAAHSRAEGSDKIRRSRDHAWDHIKSRHHEIVKIYVCNEACDDLMLIGKLEMGLRNGKDVVGEFIARVVVKGADSSSPMIKSYTVWADSAPLVKAMQKN